MRSRRLRSVQGSVDTTRDLKAFKRALAMAVLEDATDLLAEHYELRPQLARRIIVRAVQTLEEAE